MSERRSIAAEPPVAAAPPGTGEPGAAAARRRHARLPAARGVLLGDLDRLPDGLHDRPELLRPDRASATSSGSTTTRRSSRRHRSSRRSRTTRSGSRSSPALVTAIGLVFAVLTERIRWAVAFKTVGLHADGDLAVRRRRHLARHGPAGADQGAVNAGIAAVHDAFTPPGALPDASPVDAAADGVAADGLRAEEAARSRAASPLLGLTGDPARARCRRPRSRRSPPQPRAGRDRRRRVARLQARRRRARQGRAAASSACPA